jgi:predicted Zn finger-like uncharacterized protein
MIVECKFCSRKFRLQDCLLKPSGCRVRCSKCETIFRAFPEPSGSSRDPFFEKAGVAQDMVEGEIAAAFSEKRAHPRLMVSIPVICDGLDIEGNPHDLHLGAITDVSRGGLGIELFSSPVSDQVAVSFINGEDRDVRVQAEVVHSRMDGCFKTRVGLSLMGLPLEVDQFITQVMKTHYSSWADDQQIHA